MSRLALALATAKRGPVRSRHGLSIKYVRLSVRQHELFQETCLWVFAILV